MPEQKPSGICGWSIDFNRIHCQIHVSCKNNIVIAVHLYLTVPVAVALPFKWQVAAWERLKFNIDFKRKHCEIQVNCNIIVVAVHLYLSVLATVGKATP